MVVMQKRNDEQVQPEEEPPAHDHGQREGRGGMSGCKWVLS